MWTSNSCYNKIPLIFLIPLSIETQSMFLIIFFIIKETCLIINVLKSREKYYPESDDPKQYCEIFPSLLIFFKKIFP